MVEIKYWRVILEPEAGVWETCRDKEMIIIGYPDGPDDSNVRKFRDEMSKNDKVVSYLNHNRIGATGTIVGDYSYDETILRRHYFRTRKVHWEHRSSNGWEFELSEETKAKLVQRQTVVELEKNNYEEILKQILLK
jgi:predicted Mrr-cat superfamily restriction endonuclease